MYCHFDHVTLSRLATLRLSGHDRSLGIVTYSFSKSFVLVPLLSFFPIQVYVVTPAPPATLANGIIGKGIIYSSEAIAELRFLLVENYNYLTASVGLRIVWESLAKHILIS